MLGALWWALNCSGFAQAEEFQAALPGYVFHFPADHAAHPAFRTEWWYTTGHFWVGTKDPADAHRRPDGGFELTFFRSGIARPAAPRASAWAARDVLFAHFAVTDLRGGGRFHVAEKIGRDALGMAGADSTRYRVWVDDWEAGAVASDKDSLELRASAPEHGLALRLFPEKPPAVHGQNGVSKKGPAPGQASHYVSLSRLAFTGEARIGTENLPVYGEAWMDHEFTTGELPAGLAGWDWFGLQLDDGSELMLYRLRRADGTWAPESSGSWIAPDGRVVTLASETTTVTSDRTWKSPVSGATYPARWQVQVRVPAADGVAARTYALTIEPEMAEQELVTRESTGVTYWEGACRVAGTRDGTPVAGLGYVELTGYAGTFRARM